MRLAKPDYYNEFFVPEFYVNAYFLYILNGWLHYCDRYVSVYDIFYITIKKKN